MDAVNLGYDTGEMLTKGGKEFMLPGDVGDGAG